MVLGHSQTRAPVTLTVAGLREQVRRVRAGLCRLGVTRGDRVAAYAPNIPETFVLMLATASLGAVFSSCAPEFGTRSVVDRWQQIAPKVLVAVDGYVYGGPDAIALALEPQRVIDHHLAGQKDHRELVAESPCLDGIVDLRLQLLATIESPQLHARVVADRILA